MKHQVLGYFIYMGDILIICDNIISNIISVLKNFNISPTLIIPLEQELGNRINVLDITVTNSSNSLGIGIYIENHPPTTRLYGQIYATHWNMNKPL
jgi:hypothetical protein